MTVVLWYLSLISFYPNLTQVLIIVSCYIPHHSPSYVWSLLTFWFSIYGSDDYQLLLTAFHRITQLSLGFMRSLVLLHWHEWLSMGSMSWAKWTASDAVIVNSKNASESCQQIPTLQYDTIDLFLLCEMRLVNCLVVPCAEKTCACVQSSLQVGWSEETRDERSSLEQLVWLAESLRLYEKNV